MNKFTNEWDINDIQIEECTSIDYNNSICQPDWSDMSNNAMHFEFTLETWFDVDKKFDICTLHDPNTWVNLFAYYDPNTKELFIEYCIDSENSSDYFIYNPTSYEKQLIVNKIESWVQDNYNLSAKNYINQFKNK